MAAMTIIAGTMENAEQSTGRFSLFELEKKTVGSHRPHGWSVEIHDCWGSIVYTLWWTNKKLLKMAIEIVDFPIENGDFPLLC